MIKKYCIARHDDKMCFVPSCRYHIIKIGDMKKLLQRRMHSVSTTNTWTVCIHFSSTDSVAKLLLGARVDHSSILSEGSSFESPKQRSTQNAQPCEKETLEEKKNRKHLLSSFDENKSTQTSGSLFSDRSKELNETIDELELIKSLDCFIDGHGSFTSNFVSSQTKSL